MNERNNEKQYLETCCALALATLILLLASILLMLISALAGILLALIGAVGF